MIVYACVLTYEVDIYRMHITHRVDLRAFNRALRPCAQNPQSIEGVEFDTLAGTSDASLFV